jgi:hypothetical protein
MDAKEEKRVAIKFCCKADISASKAVELIQKTCIDAAVSQTISESAKDDECRRQPTTSRTNNNIATITKMIQDDQKVISRLVADTLGIPKTVVLRILAKACENEICVPDLSCMP